MKKIRKVLKNEKGQGMLEYVLLLAIVAAIILTFKGQITTWFSKATGEVTSKADGVFGG